MLPAARCVHSLIAVFSVVTLLAAPSTLLSAGCVVPVGLEPDSSDGGGVVASPNILNAFPAFPGPITLSISTALDLDLSIEDASNDELTVRFFRDWPTVPPPFQEVVATRVQTAAGEPQRYSVSLRFPWCAGTSIGRHQLDVVVSDRGFDPGDQTFRSPRTADGRVVTRSWVLECIP